MRGGLFAKDREPKPIIFSRGIRERVGDPQLLTALIHKETSSHHDSRMNERTIEKERNHKLAMFFRSRDDA